MKNPKKLFNKTVSKKSHIYLKQKSLKTSFAYSSRKTICVWLLAKKTFVTPYL